MNVLFIIAAVIAGFFILTFIIYFFNLDTKLLHAIYKPMMKRFNNMERDRKL